MENRLFKQYFEIESYIKNYSKLVEININKFSYLLNYSSNLIEKNYYILYGKVNGYFQLFSDLINEKLKFINYNNLNSYNHRILNEDNSLEIKRRSFDKANRMDDYFDDRHNSCTTNYNESSYDKLKHDEGFISEGSGKENLTNFDENNEDLDHISENSDFYTQSESIDKDTDE